MKITHKTMKKIILTLLFIIALEVTNAQDYSHHYWTERPLSWSDFVPHRADSTGAVSEFSCYFATEPVCDKIDGIKVYRHALFCGMDEANSWYVPELADYNMLRYNQVLFNLGEIVCRDYQPLVINKERGDELTGVALNEWEHRIHTFIRESEGGKNKAVVDKWIDSTQKLLKEIPATGTLPVLKDLVGIGFALGYNGTQYFNGADGYLTDDRGADISLYVTLGNHHLGIQARGGRAFSNTLTNILTAGATEEVTDPITYSFSRFGGSYEYALFDKKVVRFMPHLGLGGMTVMSNETYRNMRLVEKAFYGEVGLTMDLKFSHNMNLLYDSGRIIEYYARFNTGFTYLQFGDNRSYGINITFSIGALAKYQR